MDIRILYAIETVKRKTIHNKSFCQWSSGFFLAFLGIFVSKSPALSYFIGISAVAAITFINERFDKQKANKRRRNETT